MFSSFSPYVSPGLFPQSFGGFPQFGTGLPGPQSAHGASASFGYDQQGQSPYAFGGAMNPYLQNPFTSNQFQQNPQLTQSPQWLSGPQPQGSSMHGPFLGSGHAGAYVGSQQLVPVLAQLAQQISIQSAFIQQLGITLHQLAHQLTAQSLQPHQGAGLGVGGGIGQATGPGGAFSAQYPFGGATQGGYGGFNPQAQPWWSGNRAQTIQ